MTDIKSKIIPALLLTLNTCHGYYHLNKGQYLYLFFNLSTAYTCLASLLSSQRHDDDSTYLTKQFRDTFIQNTMITGLFIGSYLNLNQVYESAKLTLNLFAITFTNLMPEINLCYPSLAAQRLC